MKDNLYNTLPDEMLVRLLSTGDADTSALLTENLGVRQFENILARRLCSLFHN
jgi:hypothetical protein